LQGAGPKTVELVMHRLGGTHTLLAPKGWKVEGGFWQPPAQAYSWMPSRLITVSSPDGTSVRFKPNFSAIYQQIAATPQAQPGSINQAAGLLNMPMPSDAADWARWIEQDSIRSVSPGATNIQVTSIQPVPELTEKLRRLYAPMAQTMQSFNSSDANIRADQLSMAVDSVYDADGVRWQQVDAFNFISVVGQVASAFGGADYYAGWDIRDAISLRARAGQLEGQMSVLLAIVNSLRQTPEYSQQLVELQTKISGGNHAVAMNTINTYAEIARSSYNANQEINAGIIQSGRARNESQDRGQLAFVNYVHDQQDYVDPSTNSNVTLPANYERVFSNGLGEYVMTNDVSFEPGPDWSAIARARN
jgi:hypothetical protein